MQSYFGLFGLWFDEGSLEMESDRLKGSGTWCCLKSFVRGKIPSFELLTYIYSQHGDIEPETKRNPWMADIVESRIARK